MYVIKHKTTFIELTETISRQCILFECLLYFYYCTKRERERERERDQYTVELVFVLLGVFCFHLSDIQHGHTDLTASRMNNTLSMAPSASSGLKLNLHPLAIFYGWRAACHFQKHTHRQR